MRARVVGVLSWLREVAVGAASLLVMAVLLAVCGTYMAMRDGWRDWRSGRAGGEALYRQEVLREVERACALAELGRLGVKRSGVPIDNYGDGEEGGAS